MSTLAVTDTTVSSVDVIVGTLKPGAGGDIYGLYLSEPSNSDSQTQRLCSVKWFRCFCSSVLSV